MEKMTVQCHLHHSQFNVSPPDGGIASHTILAIFQHVYIPYHIPALLHFRTPPIVLLLMTHHEKTQLKALP